MPEDEEPSGAASPSSAGLGSGGTSAGPSTGGVPVLRALPHRITNHLENFQEAYVRAVAAASGVIVTRPELDEGIDLLLKHQSPSHRREAAYLEVSLKATQTPLRPHARGVSVQVDRDRYEYLRTPDPIIPKIALIMVVPPTQDEWITATNASAALRNAAYWVNLDGSPEPTAADPSVAAPLTNIFDDLALCRMMARIGQGEKP